MIRVWYSNHLDRLAELLSENLDAANRDPAADLFERPPIVVPNPQIAVYLKYEVARRTGIAAGLSFQVTEQFLATLLPPSKPALRLLDRASLRAMFLEILGAEAKTETARPLPGPVRTYLDAAGDDMAARDLRQFQLATRLARLARQYGDTRPELLRAWAEGDTDLGDGPLAETEGWQRDLWTRLVGDGGTLSRSRAQGGDQLILPLELFGRLDKLDGYRPPPLVHIFGFSYIWTGLREMLEHLGRSSEVHVYVPSSCQAFSDRSVKKGVEGHDLVRTWGRPGAEFSKMLAGLRKVSVTTAFVEPTPATTLEHLQSAILQGKDADSPPLSPDGSLAVLACPGIRREAEVIAGEIWRLVREDDARQGAAADRLRFRDIAVLIADSRNRQSYQAHLRAAFEELFDIPSTMIDLPLTGECRAVEAVLRLLDLPFGEFTRPQLLPLLTHPAVQAKFPGADADRWRAWCHQLEIVHGADRLDHEDTYIDRDLFHWDQGLRRLVLGGFMTGPRCGDERGFRLGDSEWLPHDEPVETQADAARLLLLVRSLVADARFARSARLTFTEWSAFFTKLISAYLAGDSDLEQRALASCLREAADLKRLDLNGAVVGYRVACECLREAVEGLTDARGHYLADGVAVAPLLEMRALPFRVAFVCGLGEGCFPAADGPDPLDLLSGGKRQLGDISPRDRDRYLFLETITSTHDRLYLSYVARDAQTGESLEPSSVIHELLHHLEREGQDETDAADWVRKEPLRRFDNIDILTVPVASTAAWREARARALRPSFRAHCGPATTISPEQTWRLGGGLRDWLGLCPPYQAKPTTEPARRIQVSIREIRRFLECPLQSWARLMLRIRENEGDGAADREDEPFATATLHQTTLLRDVFHDGLQYPSKELSPALLEAMYAPRAEVMARSGLMPVGLFRESDRRRHLACLGAWHHGAIHRGLLDHGPFQIQRFGRASENEAVDALRDPIVVDVPLPGPDGSTRPVPVEIHGRTELVSANLPGSMTCVTRDKAKPKDFFAGFLDAVVLNLTPGPQRQASYQAHVLTHSAKAGPEHERLFQGIDSTNARTFLSDILSDMFSGSHAYLLPCEAVFDFIMKGKRVSESIDEIKDDNRKPCSSRYGPVPNFARYDPPGDDLAEAIIARRFGLFQKSGGVVSQ
ncbi:DNA helicase/exodeoxyribonuclease V, gamma subunit [Singulisphaera sp. GP187]|uniref:exodeoxyribonuclease V subunit gamma n=1 Tax=Singulisphaera sp. GP187 TaxID=1882752 RepID=UPI00092C515D|nr:exodeoxyribonuclease V subunit gamma [Singulisphaera sp. GP187]SIN71293.1 DNA helicase/exodeoxyribonuclease V, gamma subunit [Singulisphaera sp. GP187]